MPAPTPRRPSIAGIRAVIRALGDHRNPAPATAPPRPVRRARRVRDVLARARRNPRPGDGMCAFGYALADATPTDRTNAATTEPDDADRPHHPTPTGAESNAERPTLTPALSALHIWH